VIVAFFIRRSELERRFPTLAAALEPDGGLWIAWPKRSSGVTTDLTEDVVREIAIAHRGSAANPLYPSLSTTLGSAQNEAISRDSLPPCQASGDSPSASLIRRASGRLSA
jgi:hypothetical protein